MPVPLGSPKNTFGTGDLLAGANRENFWAANGYCAGHESGDLKLARFESYSVEAAGGPPSATTGRPRQWITTPPGTCTSIQLPQAQLALRLEVYDGLQHLGRGTPRDDADHQSQAVTTVFQIFGADDTPLDTGDNPLLATTTVTTNSPLYKNLWTPLHTWVNPTAGTYYVRVRTQAQTTESRASNGYGLRAYTGVLFSTCTGIVGQTGYSASCPQIHGVGDMSIYANLGGAAGRRPRSTWPRSAPSTPARRCR